MARYLVFPIFSLPLFHLLETSNTTCFFRFRFTSESHTTTSRLTVCREKHYCANLSDWNEVEIWNERRKRRPILVLLKIFLRFDYVGVQISICYRSGCSVLTLIRLRRQIACKVHYISRFFIR